MRSRWMVAGAVLAVVAVLIGGARSAPWVLGAVAGLRGGGPAAAVEFAAAYALGSLLMLPASWFQGASGFLYGPIVGVATSWVLSTSSGVVAFELARGGLRERVTARLAAGGRLAAIDRAIGRRGLVAVILLRLSPFAPYNIVSYGLGTTSVPRQTFILGTMIGSLFPSAVWTLVGSSIADLAALGQAGFGGARWAVLGVTLGASAGVALFVRRALSEPG